jgi:hypothetical protein
MDYPVWWNEETAATADRMECTLQEVVSYAVKQYCYKIGYLKIVTCIIEMMYYWLCIRFCIISL